MRKPATALIAAGMAVAIAACGSSSDSDGGDAGSGGAYGTGLELSDRVVRSAPVGASVEPWYRWNRDECAFEVARDHPARYRADVREIAGGDSKIGYMHYGNSDSFGISNSKSIEAVAQDAGMDLDVYSLKYPSRTEPNTAANSAVVKQDRSVIQANLDVSVLPGFFDILEGDGCMPSVQLYIPIEGRPAMGNHWPDVGVAIGSFIAEQAAQRRWDPAETALVQCTDPDNGPSVNAMFRTGEEAVRDRGFDIPQANVFELVCKQQESQAGYKRVTDWFTSHPDFRHVAFTAIDSIRMQEMIRAVEQEGRPDDDVLLAAASDDEMSRRSVRAGEQDMSVAFFGERYGDYTIPMLQDLMAGNPVPSFVGTELVQLTQDNIDRYYPER